MVRRNASLQSVLLFLIERLDDSSAKASPCGRFAYICACLYISCLASVIEGAVQTEERAGAMERTLQRTRLCQLYAAQSLYIDSLR